MVKIYRSKLSDLVQTDLDYIIIFGYKQWFIIKHLRYTYKYIEYTICTRLESLCDIASSLF